MSDRIKKECELKLSNNSIFGGLKCKFGYIFCLFLDYFNKFLCMISVQKLECSEHSEVSRSERSEL